MNERLYPTAPFDFHKMIQRPLSRPSKLSVIDPMTMSYTTAVRMNTKVIPITIVAQGTVDDPAITLTYPDHLSQSERLALRDRVRFMFFMDVDLSAFYERMATDAVWAPLIERLRGLRPIYDADLFESMVKVIIGQQMNVKFAATLVDRLVELGGETVEWNSELLPVFPSPEQVASWSYEQLRALSFSQRKAEYVIDFARAVVNENVDLARLWQMPDEQVHEVLIPLRGIGRWTIECFLLFGMGRQDVMPAADIGIQNAVQKLYGLPQRPREEEIRSLAEAWAPCRSYATYYLWQSLIAERLV
jgi:DNA-3-methyladenine glycosylase II